MIMTLRDIDTSTKEGKLLMAALAILTTESRTHQTPDTVLEACRTLTETMYTEDPVKP